MAEQNLGYSAAIKELEAILESIESEAIDLDHLAAKVQRAADLIRLCRDRIRATEQKVVKVVKDLEAEQAAPDLASAGGDELSG
ncbi:MAG: exodeoxyribonuclease VII small subunit [Planctomycetota bacterium]